ncbi:hypothetical protein MuYL_1335 [Mucilaginibacter xinganensis]|uniref:Uncharacterized protein n=1 Tax=Mucilaginibacter xinganensis TaxID=1234841 RepID=A0A223NTP4_9SPHI|nr:hypothetical protein MuYL_1335 [Mucilaginibacter xinganensis]
MLCVIAANGYYLHKAEIKLRFIGLKDFRIFFLKLKLKKFEPA